MTKHEALGMVLVVLIALAALQVPVSPPNIRPDIEQIEWDRQPPNVASPERDGEEEMASWFGNRAESPMTDAAGVGGAALQLAKLAAGVVP
jgi:hypothetical protein